MKNKAIRLLSSLYIQVLLAISVGIFLGHFYPELGTAMQPLGTAFIKLIKMIIAPIIFCTGYAYHDGTKDNGRDNHLSS